MHVSSPPDVGPKQLRALAHLGCTREADTSELVIKMASKILDGSNTYEFDLNLVHSDCGLRSCLTNLTKWKG